MPSWWLACGDQHQHTGSGSTLEALHGDARLLYFILRLCVCAGSEGQIITSTDSRIIRTRSQTGEGRGVREADRGPEVQDQST